MLTYRRHLESFHQMLTPWVAHLWRLAGSGWGTNITNSCRRLIHPTADYCVPVWCRSAHTRLIDPVIDETLSTVIGCLRRTSANNLPILAGIQPEFCRFLSGSLCYCLFEPHTIRSKCILSPNPTRGTSHIQHHDVQEVAIINCVVKLSCDPIYSLLFFKLNLVVNCNSILLQGSTPMHSAQPLNIYIVSVHSPQLRIGIQRYHVVNGTTLSSKFFFLDCNV